GSGAVLRRHVGDGGAVAHAEGIGAFTIELQIGAYDTLTAQKFGQGQYQIGAGDAGLETAHQFNTDDVRQAHHGRVAQHYVLGFQATHTNGDHAQRVHHRGMAVCANTGIGERHAVAHLHYRRHFFQVDLVHDAVTRRDHIDIVEGRLAPVD